MIRARVINFILIGMFLFLILGLLNHEVVRGRRYRELSNKNSIRLLPQRGARGKIFDRQGNIIVGNKLSFDVFLLPQEFNPSTLLGINGERSRTINPSTLLGINGERSRTINPSTGLGIDKRLSKVSDILGLKPKDLKEAFRFGYMAPSLPVTIAKNIDLKKAIALEELKIDLPGIVIQPNPVRDYPFGSLASHVIGYVNEIDYWRLSKLADYGYKTKDLVGFGGVEEKYDYYLRQQEGGISVEVDHKGKFRRLLGFKQPNNGKNIQLTLDLKIQKIVEGSLQGRKGCVILMQPHSGEIIAMASFPRFKPSVFVDREAALISNLSSDPDSPLRNSAISAAFPPGSIFKIIVAVAGLETRRVNPHMNLFCQGSTLIGKRKFNCWDTHQEQDLTNAIAQSCNVFFYRAGLSVGAGVMHNYAVKFGLSKPTAFELPYEVAGLIPSQRSNIPFFAKERWFDGDTANFSIGQGQTLTTPLQLTRMMAVFANQGYLVRPYVVKAIDTRDISLYQRKLVKIPIKKTTIDYIRGGLRKAVADSKGTANTLSKLSTPVAGKTGTAQAPPGRPHAWFVGFFPYEEPKFVICVFLERGQSGYYSALLAKEIIGKLIGAGLI